MFIDYDIESKGTVCFAMSLGVTVVSRFLSIALCLLIAQVLGSCNFDPTCSDSCDGSKIVSCKWTCSGSGKIDVDECHREHGGSDCAAQIGPSGKPMTCKMATVAINSNSQTPYCVDGNMPCKTRGQMTCTGPHSMAVCAQTADGNFYKASDQSTNPCLGANNECHNNGDTLACVDTPKVSCKPAEYPKCTDTKTLVTCLGTPQAGYFLFTISCSASLTCQLTPQAGCSK